MHKKVQTMRFLDLTNPDDPTYVTIYVDGPKFGYFHRGNKKNLTDTTTIRPNHRRLYEIKFLGGDWRSIGRTEFMLRLSTINTWRKGKDMPIIAMPEVDDEE